jgi:hypothetical protein
LIWERRHGPVGTGMKEGFGAVEGNLWSNFCQIASFNCIVLSVWKCL